jgi:hypothetical protein
VGSDRFKEIPAMAGPPLNLMGIETVSPTQDCRPMSETVCAWAKKLEKTSINNKKRPILGVLTFIIPWGFYAKLNSPQRKDLNYQHIINK